MHRFFKTSLLLCLGLACLCTALIRPADRFDANADAKRVHEALFGDNNRAITMILTNRSGEQRVAIAQAYKSAYSKNLVEDFQSELSGDFEDLMVAMVTPLPEYYAKELYDNAHPLKRSSNAIVDILATSSPAEVKAIDEAYKRLKLTPHMTLLQLVCSFVPALSDRMVSVAFNGGRSTSQEVDVNAAIADAKAIYNSGELKTGYTRTFAEEDEIEIIFVTRSYKQLTQICEEYEKLYGHGIEKAFVRGFGNNLATYILNLIPVAKSIPYYFAKRLYDSMHGFGTTDRVLIRIIVGRSEIDMDEIRDAFWKTYGVTLGSMIEDDTSGDYMFALYSVAYRRFK